MAKDLEESTRVEEEDVIVIRTTEAKLKEAEHRIITEITNLNDIPSSLHLASVLAFVFQLVQGAALIIVASNSRNQWYCFTSFPNTDDNLPGYQPELKVVASFPIEWFSPIFILMSGVEHLSTLVFRDNYEWYLRRNQNPFRWFEYTFSAALMRVMLAQLAGITDVHLLFSIFVLTSMTIQCGSTCESVNAKARADGMAMNWRPFFIAWISQLACWGIIFSYFIHGATSGTMPPLLWVIILLLFFLDTTFALLFTLQWMKIPPFDGKTPRVERDVFMFLPSLFASHMLHLLVNFVFASSCQSMPMARLDSLRSVLLPKRCWRGLLLGESFTKANYCEGIFRK